MILHNAWSVDFNLAIESRENFHIAEVRNFINWSLLPPRTVTIQFVSSLGSLANWPSLRPKTPVPEQISTDSNLPMLGYGQSMFVSESILNNAAESTVSQLLC